MKSSLTFLLLLWFLQSISCDSSCRCTPDQPCWPSPDQWSSLNASVHGHLSIPLSPVDPCLHDAELRQDQCQEALVKFGSDPFWLQTLPGGTESTGQLDGWTAMPSSYSVEVMDQQDIVNAVNFAAEFNLRLVVKGTGHDYYGRSSSPDSLLIWTHSMRNIEFHDNFEPTECAAGHSHPKEGIPAVTLEAGLTWMDVYAAANDRNLYVQGGGCTSVGVVGWTIGGGYGSFSKLFGTGPANLLEATIVTADGQVVVASECQNTDLFYALRGGGYGFGVVVSLTVRTHPLPENFGHVNGYVVAHNAEGYQKLVATFLDFYQTNLLGPNWGESFNIIPKTYIEGIGEVNFLVSFSLMHANLTKTEADSAWESFNIWLTENEEDYDWDISIDVVPAIEHWTQKGHPSTPYDPSEPDRAFFWAGNVGEISAYWIEYYSRFLRMDQLMTDVEVGAKNLIELAKATFTASIHVNKAQFGASQWAVDELENTAMHPSSKDSFGLLLTGMRVSHYSPLVPVEYQYNTSNILGVKSLCGEDFSSCQNQFKAGYDKFRAQTPGAGSYFNEADYFEPDFQENFWGLENYRRLLSIKNKWDPESLFYCHNCVGSEFWEDGGFCRK